MWRFQEQSQNLLLFDICSDILTIDLSLLREKRGENTTIEKVTFVFLLLWVSTLDLTCDNTIFHALLWYCTSIFSSLWFFWEKRKIKWKMQSFYFSNQPQSEWVPSNYFLYFLPYLHYWKWLQKQETIIVVEYMFTVAHNMLYMKETCVLITDSTQTRNSYRSYCLFYPNFISKTLINVYLYRK